MGAGVPFVLYHIPDDSSVACKWRQALLLEAKIGDPKGRHRNAYETAKQAGQ